MAKKTKSQAKPKKAAGTAPARTIQDLSDDERQALHFKHVGEYEGALGAKKKADADLKNVAKRIKAEGGQVALCKLTVALRTEEGETAFRERITRETEVAQWNGVGVQIDMFGQEDQTPSLDRARAAGKRAGMQGEPAKPPYQPGSEEYQAWLEAHHDGNAALAKGGFKPLSEAASSVVEKAAPGMPREEWKKQMSEQTADFGKGPKIGDAPPTHQVVS